jgi:hypothetical protein
MVGTSARAKVIAVGRLGLGFFFRTLEKEHIFIISLLWSKHARDNPRSCPRVVASGGTTNVALQFRLGILPQRFNDVAGGDSNCAISGWGLLAVGEEKMEMTSRDVEIDDWYLDYDGRDLLILGPDGLKIIVRQFHRAKIQHNLPVVLETNGDRQQQDWVYPLGEGTALHLVSNCGPNSEVHHQLRLGDEGEAGGWQVVWNVPDSLAVMLYQLEALSGGG